VGLGERQHRIEQSLVDRDLVTLMVYRVCSKMGKRIVDEATKAAKAIVAQIRNSFSYFDAELVRLLPLFLLLGPHLEFAVPVWNPHLRESR
jgi:hypothetical protein